MALYTHTHIHTHSIVRIMVPKQKCAECISLVNLIVGNELCLYKELCLYIDLRAFAMLTYVCLCRCAVNYESLFKGCQVSV